MASESVPTAAVGRHRRHASPTWWSRRAASCGLFKSPTVPHDPVQGILDVLGVAAAADGARPAPSSSRQGHDVHARHHPRAERGAHRQRGAHRACSVTAGPSGHPAAARGRPAGPLRLHRAVSRSPTCRAASPSRCPERLALHRRASSTRFDRAAVEAVARSDRRARGRGRRGVPALVDREPRARARRGRGARPPAPGCAVHAVARAQPLAARVPACLVDGDRRIPQAADVGVHRRASRRG